MLSDAFWYRQHEMAYLYYLCFIQVSFFHHIALPVYIGGNQTTQNSLMSLAQLQQPTQKQETLLTDGGTVDQMNNQGQKTLGFMFGLQVVESNPIVSDKRPDISLSGLFRENRDLSEPLITDLYSVCSEKAYFCEYEIEKKNSPVKEDFKNFTATSPCCVYCSCSNECHLAHSCCPSKWNEVTPNKNSKFFNFLSCFDTYKYITQTAVTVLRASGYKPQDGYLFVSSCPERASDENKYLCEAVMKDDRRSVMDTVPVTDVANNIHFANRFCAACHNVQSENAKLWEVRVGCFFGEDISNFSNLEYIVRGREDCFFDFSPPEDVMKSSLLSCQADLVNVCNSTGKWALYDKRIEERCLDPRLEEIHNTVKDGVFKRYKNVFCAMCNGEDIGLIDCDLTGVINTEPIPFATILAFSSTEVANLGYTEKICRIGHIFIPYLAVCEMVHCISPFITDVIHNTCSPPKKLSGPLVIHMPVKVTLSPSVPFSGRQEIRNHVINMLLSVAYFCDCDLSIVYELDSLYQPHMNSTTMNNENIKALYISVHFVDRYVDHRMFLDLALSFVISRNVTVLGSNVLIESIHNIIDPLSLDDQGNDIPQMFVKKNPYTQFALVLYPSASKCICKLNVTADVQYPPNFMDCPSFLLPFEKYNIIRINNGLRVGQTGKQIGFNNFKSLNSTHVYICIESLIGKSIQSRAGRALFGNTFILLSSLVFLSFL